MKPLDGFLVKLYIHRHGQTYNRVLWARETPGTDQSKRDLVGLWIPEDPDIGFFLALEWPAHL